MNAASRSVAGHGPAAAVVPPAYAGGSDLDGEVGLKESMPLAATLRRLQAASRVSREEER